MKNALPMQEMPKIRGVTKKQNLEITHAISIKHLNLLYRIVELSVHTSSVPILLRFFPFILLIPRWNKVKHISSLDLS